MTLYHFMFDRITRAWWSALLSSFVRLLTLYWLNIRRYTTIVLVFHCVDIHILYPFFFFSHSCLVAYTEISATTRTLSLSSGSSRTGGASMHPYTASLIHAQTYAHRKYRGTLCTRSDRCICSLFRRVFVFRGTLFTTGQRSHKYATRSAGAFCSPIFATFIPSFQRSFIRSYVHPVVSLRSTFISTIICKGTPTSSTTRTVERTRRRITRTASNDNEPRPTGYGSFIFPSFYLFFLLLFC